MPWEQWVERTKLTVGMEPGLDTPWQRNGWISTVCEDEGRSATWELEAEILLWGCLRVRPPCYSLGKWWFGSSVGHESCAHWGEQLFSEKNHWALDIYLGNSTRLDKQDTMKFEKLLHIKINNCQSKDTAYKMGEKSLPNKHIDKGLILRIYKEP